MDEFAVLRVRLTPIGGHNEVIGSDGKEKGRMSQVKVVVTLKPSLLDAQGRVVQDALHSLGYANVAQVRIGKYMELELTTSGTGDLDTEIKEMCDRLLTNPVIENYTYEVVK